MRYALLSVLSLVFVDPLSTAPADEPTKDRFVAPEAFHFFYVDKPLDGAKAKPTVAMVRPSAEKPDYQKLYGEAQAGKHRAAKAGAASLVIGYLPGGRHPSKYTYRVVEARVREEKIDCQLHFTYYVIPAAGPGVPTTPYFAVNLPSLPAGEYTIQFKVTKAYFDPGNGLLKLEAAKRDLLAREPYRTKFVVKKQK